MAADTAMLSQMISAIDPATLHGKFPTQYLELQALEAVALGQPKRARLTLAKLERALPDAPEPTALWRMHMLSAQLARQLHDIEAEQTAYESAEAVVDTVRRDVSSGALRERWLHSYQRSSIRLVELLLQRGALEQAACAARTARSRALAIHDLALLRAQALQHELTATQGPRCARPWGRHRDELVLLVFPQEDAGWWVFEVRENHVHSVRSYAALPEPGSDHAHVWWQDWDDALEQVDRVRILASAAAFAVPFHTLQWRGEALNAQHAVVYGLDLASKPAPRQTAGLALVAFADVDRMRSLARYANQMADLDAAVVAAGWIKQSLGAEQMQRDSLLRPLASAQLFHFYGHGQRVSAAPHGTSQQEHHAQDVGTTALQLADNSQLRVEDVLGLPQVPRQAVLMGCQLGTADLHGWAGGLNLPHAFLLAGTQQVLASTAPLDAAAAASLGPQLYAGQTAQDFDLALALRDAWAEHGEHDTTEPPWAALRVWGR